MIVALRETGIAPGILRVASLESVAARRSGRIVRGVVSVAPGAVGDRFRYVTRGFQKLPELPDRDLVLPEVEGPRDAHPVHGCLIEQLDEAPVFVLGISLRQGLGRLVATHEEFPRRHENEVHAEGVFEVPRMGIGSGCTECRDNGKEDERQR